MKKKRHYLFLLMFLFANAIIVFSNKDIIIHNDTILLNKYCQLALDYSEINRDSSVHFANLALEVAEKLDQKFYQASILSDLGYTLMVSNEYSEAISKLIKANKLMDDKKIAVNVIKTPFFNRYFTEKDPKINRIILIGYIKNSLALLYGRTDNFDKQLAELQEAKNIIESETNDLNLRYTINSNIANAYLNKGNLDSALVYQLVVMDIEKKIVNKNYTGNSDKTLGDIYFRKGDFIQAKKSYLKGLSLMDATQNVYHIGLAQFALSDTYRKLGQADSSLFFAKAGLNNYKTLGSYNIQDLEDGYSTLAMSFEHLKIYDSAYYYLQLSKNLSDSIYSSEKKILTNYQNINFNEKMRLKAIENERIRSKTRNQIIFLVSGLAMFCIIAFALYRSNTIKVKANALLSAQKLQVENTLIELRSTQAQLIQSEKMASLGELTAGIAHEIQNPLNFVNNFSDLNRELLIEMKDEFAKGNLDDANIIADDVISNEEKINYHGKRADAIVKGMLQHSRTSTGQKEFTDINALCDEYLRLAYHGLRAKDKSFNATFETSFDTTIPKISVVAQDVGRVVLNMINNAFYAINDKKNKSSSDYIPTITIQTKNKNHMVEISIKDNGSGIPDKIKDKLFQPFFTTKPTGSGTGLGLSLSYDIVKNHGGGIIVNSKENEGTEFIIQLPIV